MSKQISSNKYTNSLGEVIGEVHLEDGTTEWSLNGELHRGGGLPAIDHHNGTGEWWVNGKLHRDGGPAVVVINGRSKFWWVNGQRHREGGLPAVDMGNGYKAWYVNGEQLWSAKVPAYMAFCQKIQAKKRVEAQKKIYFWWIQICYDLDHHSGCGKRMAQKNLDVFETMMAV